MAFFSSRDDMVDDLEAQLQSLRKEVGKLRKIAAKRGAAIYDDASENASHYYDELAQRVVDAMPHVRAGAKAVERRARDNPGATAAVGLVALGLIAALVLRRSD